MKYFLTILILLYSSLQCVAQDAPQVKADPVTECIVYFIDDTEKAAKSDDDELSEGMEVGRFLPTPGGEGTLTVRRFRVGKSNLYIFASVFYEDDLFYDDILHDAMTLALSITTSTNKNADKNPKLRLAFTGMQIDDREDFGAANLYALVKRKGKDSAISMNCQRKKS